MLGLHKGRWGREGSYKNLGKRTDLWNLCGALVDESQNFEEGILKIKLPKFETGEVLKCTDFSKLLRIK